MTRLLRLADGVDKVLGAVCQAIIMATCVVLLVMLAGNVAARYVFEQGGIAWISELPEQLFPWLIGAGVVLAVQHNAHIAVDFALTVFGRRVGLALAILVNLLLVVAYVVLLIVVLRVAEIAAIERSPLLGLSRSYGYLALAFACVGTVIASFVIVLRLWCSGFDALPRAQAEDSPV